MGTGRLSEQWEEALDPALDGAAINDQPALGEPRDDIGVAEPVPARLLTPTAYTLHA